MSLLWGPILFIGLILGNIKLKLALSKVKVDFIYINLGPVINHPALSCNAIRCIKAKAAKTKGNTKCNAKNLFKVALLTEQLC
jgi:hypothetical protein